MVRFEVKDTGVGMDDAAKSRLFKAFSQVSAMVAYQGLPLGPSQNGGA